MKREAIGCLPLIIYSSAFVLVYELHNDYRTARLQFALAYNKRVE